MRKAPLHQVRIKAYKKRVWVQKANSSRQPIFEISILLDRRFVGTALSNMSTVKFSSVGVPSVSLVTQIIRETPSGI